MPGSWEIQNQQSVLAAVLHTDNTTIAWSFGLRNLQIPGQIIGLAGMPYDMARNVACMKALECGASHIFFLDSDVIPPPDAVLRLMAHKLPIVSGVYCRRSHPAGVPVMMKPLGQWITQFPANSLIEVDVVGAGCLLIHRSVLETLPPQSPGKHWFDWRVDQQGNRPKEECLSEDFTFMMHAKKYGYKTIVDTSIICRHVGFAQAGLGTFTPMESIAA